MSGRKISKAEAVALSQDTVEKLFPLLLELEAKGLSRCQALATLENATRAMHHSVHRRELEMRMAAPTN